MIASPANAAEPQGVRTAFFYGTPLPDALVDHYDRVVVDPDHLPSPHLAGGARAQLLAYVSLGEVSPNRSWHSEVPSGLWLGQNQAFHSNVVDVRRPEWRAFVLQRVIGPLWRQGYRGFFLDTLDSYKLFLEKPAERAAAERGLARLIRDIKNRYPAAKLVANRGFELLPTVGSVLDGIVAESLFRGYDAKNQRFTRVPEADRNWLERKLSEARTRYHLPVVVIDYLPRSAQQARRDTAAAIAKLGFMPWVATPGLDDFGVGAVEVIPRRVLIVHDGAPNAAGVSRATQLLAPPLEALGYTVDECAIGGTLPSDAALQTVAGVVAWVRAVPAERRPAWRQWILHQRKEGVRIAFLESFGFDADASFLQSLGLVPIESPIAPKKIVSKAPWIGFEASPPLRRRDRLHVRADGVSTHSLLRIIDDAAQPADAVAVGGWGGVGFAPYVLADGPEYTQRWILDPVEFLRAALALPAIPSPDVTTESGRRLVTSVVSGEGFAVPSELRGNPPAGQVILDSILTREGFPTTVSFDASGVDDGDGGRLAQRIAALPQVEIAAQCKSADEPGWQSVVPKSAVVLVPDVNTAARASSGTLILLEGPRSQPRLPESASMTMLQPLGLSVRGRFVTLVPGVEDLQYTSGFVAPFDRYRRAIQTFAVDDGPRRMRSIGIRYSFLSGSKTASIRALRDVYAAVRQQEVFPLWLSEYASRVRGFDEATVAQRLDGGWEIARLGELRTLRIAPTDWPDLEASQGVIGARTVAQGRFIHLVGPRVRLMLRPSPPERVYLAHANARVSVWAWTGQGVRISLEGHMPVELVVQGAGSGPCTLTARGRVFNGKKDSSGVHFSLPWSEIHDAALSCVR